MIQCRHCKAENPDDARFCINCGRPLAGESEASTAPPSPPAESESGANILAGDGLPIGEDLDGIPGGERILWRGRPHKLFSPILSLTTRYKLTNERLLVEHGFVSRRTEEIELYRVYDVAVKQGPMERIFRYGDILIETSDKTAPQFRLENVGNPIHVKDIMRLAARTERERRRVLLREEM